MVGIQTDTLQSVLTRKIESQVKCIKGSSSAWLVALERCLLLLGSKIDRERRGVFVCCWLVV